MHETSKLSVSRILVIVDQQACSAAQVKHDPLIARAIEVAKATGADVELFTVCYDYTVHQALFASDAAVVQRPQAITDQAATRLAELALEFRGAGVGVSQDAVWDAPLADAVLRKIKASQPDLVMTRSQDHDYVIGFSRNTDWTLIRQSSAHVWFVKENLDNIDRILTAIGTLDSDESIIAASDYEVYRYASRLADVLAAENVPVHTYQVPQGLEAYAGYVPNTGGLGLYPGKAISESSEDRHEKVAAEHGRIIREFAAEFDLDADQVLLEAGHPALVLPPMAEKLSADLIVMGARNLSRWERMLSSVTAEPVLAKTASDVLIVRDELQASEMEAVREVPHGQPAVEVERAVVDPASVFRKPGDIVKRPGLSTRLRIRILQAWRQDVLAEQVGEDEANMIGAPSGERLTEIDRLINQLESEEGQRSAA